MDTNENLSQNLPPVRARKKHIVMLVTACVLLAAILIFLSLPTGMSAPDAPDGPTDPYALVGGTIYWIGNYLLVGFAVFVGVAVAWIAGLVVSVKLARRRADKPMWLWVASLAVLGGYLMLAAVLVVAMFV